MHGDVQADRLPEARHPLFAERRRASQHVEAGFERPFGIVLMGDRGAEQRQHRIAQVLGHVAAAAVTAQPSESNRAPWKARTSSESSRSESEVKPQRSANSTVTGRRSVSSARPFGATADGRWDAPQRGQKAKSAEIWQPQLTQVIDRLMHNGGQHNTGSLWHPRPRVCGAPHRAPPDLRKSLRVIDYAGVM
jgi:hypothetical protein